MVQKVSWNDRHFEMSVPISMFPNVLERLRGTPARLEDLVKNVDSKILCKRDGNSWSIQEIICHLVLTEKLMLGRLDDFVQRLDRLRSFDRSEQSRLCLKYNKKSIESILIEYRKERERLIARLELLSDANLNYSAVHPGINKSVRIIDQMYLAAEHDDHHLARISELKRMFGETQFPS